MSELLSRKFIFAILATVLSFVLVLQGILEVKDWIAFISVIGGLYIAGNVAEHFADKK